MRLHTNGEDKKQWEMQRKDENMDSKCIVKRSDYDMHRSQTHPDVSSQQPDPQHHSQAIWNLKNQNSKDGGARLMEKETGVASS